VDIKSFFAGISAGTDELGFWWFSDFDQTKPAPTVIAQARIIAESGNFEAVKFTCITDGPSFLDIYF
jgi:hypothetical protein